MATRGKLINTVAGLGSRQQGTVQPNAQMGLGALAPKPTPAPQAQPAAAAPAAPAPAAGPAVFTPDAAYLAAVAQSAFTRTNQLNQLDTEGRDQKTDTEEAIRRLLAKVPDDRRGITAGANRQGLLFGGHHSKQLDDYQGQVTRSESDQRLALQRGDDARAAIRKALQDGVPLEEAAFKAEAAERQLGRDQDAAALNMLAPPPAEPAAAPARRAPVVTASRPQPKSKPKKKPKKR